MAEPLVVFVTSSAPWGTGEAFLAAEMDELARRFPARLAVLPAWRRGTRQNWPTTTLHDIGVRPASIATAVGFVARHPAVRAAAWWSVASGDIRDRAKRLAGLIQGLRWGVGLGRAGVEMSHVHSWWLSAPALCAWGLARGADASFVLDRRVAVSATGHRSDVVHRAPRRLLRQFCFVRAISMVATKTLVADEIGARHLALGAAAVPTPTRGAPTAGATLRCIAIGSSLPVKRHELAVSMVQDANARGCRVTLDIAGDGPGQRALARRLRAERAEDDISLLGWVAHDDLVARLQAGEWDVLLHPSAVDGPEVEGVPIAVVEAMFAGVTVVATPSGAAIELVDDTTAFVVRAAPGAEATEGGRVLAALTSIPDEVDARRREAAHRVAEQHDAASTVATFADWLGLVPSR